jgi:nucleoside-diphosphate-sugar epimerase
MAGLPAKAVVLLTGATGFLGGHILARLLRERCILHAINRSGSGPSPERVTWHAADLRRPEAALELVRRIRPTHLLHNAWIAVPGRFWSDHENLDWLQAGLSLLRGFGETGGQRFVGVGSCAEYDWNQEHFIEEETPIRPATLYGKSKTALWVAAQAFAAQYGFTAAWGRVFLPYGPGDPPERLIPTVIASLIARREIALGDGNRQRDFVFAADAADLLVRLLCESDSGVFNVGTGHGIEIHRVVEILAERLGGRSLIRFNARPANQEPKNLVADMKKVAALFRWSATADLDTELHKLVSVALAQKTALAET